MPIVVLNSMGFHSVFWCCSGPFQDAAAIYWLSLSEVFVGTVGRHQLLHDTVSGEHIFAAESWCAWACCGKNGSCTYFWAPSDCCAFRDHVLQLKNSVWTTPKWLVDYAQQPRCILHLFRCASRSVHFWMDPMPFSDPFLKCLFLDPAESAAEAPASGGHEVLAGVLLSDFALSSRKWDLRPLFAAAQHAVCI